MASSDPAGAAVSLVVMGVSGVGKTSVGTALAAATGRRFVEGDDLHPEANRRRMAAGIALDDDDRWPWLREVADRIADARSGGGLVVTCSALRRSYRDLLRTADPELVLVHLTAGPDVLAGRVACREHEYMPARLLDSQLATLEPPTADERVVTVDATRPLPDVVDAVLRGLPTGTVPGRS